jgi:outer membrane protein assembly factor BamB
MVNVVLAAFFAAPAAASMTPSPIIDNSPRSVLIRTGTPGERMAFANSAVIPLVDYGGFVLATVSGEMFAKFSSKQMILRVLSDRTTLYLGSAQFDTMKGEPTIADDLRVNSYPAGTAGLYIVQFIGPILPRWVTDLKAQGAVAYNYVPNFAFIVEMTPEQAVRVSQMRSVQWVGIYQPAYRISHLVYDEFNAPDALTSRVPMAPIPYGKPITSGHLALSPIATGVGVTDRTNGRAAAPAKTTTKSYDLSVLMLKSSPTATARSLGVFANRIYQTMDLGRLELVRISTNAANLAEIASLPGVYWVEPYYQPHVLDEVASQISAGNYNPLAPGYLPWLGSVGFNGTGIRVAVADTGVDTGVDDPNVTGDMHAELDNRVVANLWYGYLTSGEDGYGHGTHVAGIVAGNGSLGTMDGDGYLYGLGIAPDAGIINQRIFDSGGGWAGASYYDLGSGAVANGASVSSNSWGISDFGSYLVDDMIYDGLVRDADSTTAGNQQLIFEFSAGNSGWGFGTPVYGSTGSPGNAKNVITTGATLNYRPTVPNSNEWPADNIDASIGFSSRGPTADGRIKPDIVAPGGWIASLLSSASFPGWCWRNIDAYHEYCGGTSMSGPMVSGGAALFVQYYRALTGAGDPSPALTKAALVNGAIDMPPVSNPSYGSFSTGPIPNMDEGWGRMQLANVIASTGAHFYDDQQHPLSTGDSYSYQIAVGITSQPVKVSLAWTDAPGSPGASTELVNDLDLTVTTPDGTTYLGNNFADGMSAPGGTPDSKNNLENVYIDTSALQVGVYTVTVTGVNVVNVTQDYAIVVSYGGGPTSTGQVFWNHRTFRSDALAGAILMDIDLNVDPGAPDSATVTATSDTGDSETVTVTEAGNSSGVFTGTIQFTSAPSSPEDGVLTVANLGTVTLTYVDASPAGTRTDNATIDDDPPVISGIAVSGLTHNSARVNWLTDEVSTTVFRYGTSPPPTNLAVGASGTSHSVSLSGLAPNTTYYFEVESTDGAGNTAVDNNGGAYYTFITLPIPPVILVDNDYGNNYETYYESALTTAGQDFDYWNVATQGYPTTSDLGGYAVVIWFSPSCGLNDPTAQATIAAYLDAGGRLIASGQDIGWCSQFYGGPLLSRLHATYVVDDPGTRSVNGVSGDDIGDGLAISIAGGDGANDNFFPDVMDPIAPAVTGAVYASGPSSQSAIIHVDTGTYQVAYLDFNFEGISSAADRANVMDRLLGWIIPPPYGVRISPGAIQQDASPGQTVTYAFTVKNRGVATPSDTFDFNWSSGPLGWTTSLWDSVGNPVTDTNGDGIPDTGPIPSKGSALFYATVDVPAGAVDGDSDGALIVANSVTLPSATSSLSLTTLVPLPGVQLSAGTYIPVTAGQTVLAPMSIRNAGGQDDTLNLVATSMNGWSVTLTTADGSAPLTDTDGDGHPDVGIVAGLQWASFGVQVVVPAGATPGTIDLTTIVGSPARDPTATQSSSVVLEYYGPGPSDWPTFHNTNARRGASPNLFSPPMSLLWSASGATANYYSGPIYAGGMLISTSLDQYIRARDPFTGTVIWSRDLGSHDGLLYYTGTPTYLDGVVYIVFYAGPFGQCLAPTCGVYALDAATGATLWHTGPEVGVNFNSRTSVAVSDGMVFGGAWDGQIWALDASTGSLLWTYQTPLYPWAGVTAAAGTVWVAGTDPFLSSGTLYALDDVTGTLKWSAPLGAGGGSAPLFAHGNVYVGTWNGFQGSILAFNAFTGDPVWTSDTFCGFWFDTPAYDGTNLYVGDTCGAVRALDSTTGATIWTGYAGYSVQSSSALVNGSLFVTSWDGNLYVFDTATGALVDEHFLSFFGSSSHPAVGLGYVWLEDTGGTLYAFGAPGAGVMASLQALPDTASVEVGLAIRFHAQAYDVFGNPSPGGPYTWSSTNGLGSVLPLSPNGDEVVYIAGVYSGTDTLHVQSGAFGADATVSILPGALDHVDILPGVASVVAGTTMSFNANAKDRFGNTIAGATFVWTATGGIGTIDASGLLTASTQVGTGFVTATTGSSTGTAIVEIVPGALASVALQPAAVSLEAGSNLALHAQGFDRYGNEISGLTFGWATTIGSIAPVETGSPTAVLAAGYLAGSGTVTISSGGVTRVVGVVVTPGPLDRIQVVMIVGGSRFEGPVDIPAGAQRTFVAETTDRFGNAIANVPLLWSVTGGSGTIDSNGAFTASTTVGAGSVIATYASGMTGRQDVTIVPATPATVDIGLTSTSLAVDSNSVIVATVLDAYGNANPDGVVTWTTTGTGTILSLTPDGRSILYHAPITTTPASVQVTASIGAVSRAVTLTIVAGPPVGISIDSPATTVAIGGTLAFGVVVTDQFGNAVTGATIAWEATAGSISQQGVFRAPSEPGLVVITASTAGRQSFVVIEVTSGALDQFSRQATSATSLALILATIIAVAAGVFLFVRYREARRELQEMRKGGGGGAGGGEP